MKLSVAQVEQFHRDGFLHVSGVFDASDLNPLKQAITAELNRRCKQLLAEGLIKDAHYDAPFETRFGLLLEQADEIQGAFDIDSLGFNDFFTQLGNPKILDVIESIIGPEISINPIHHLRAKPPAHQKETGYFSVPWHQDAGVLTENTDDQLIITAWYPIGEATEEMGCMSLIPGIQPGTLLPHIRSDYGTTIHPDFMPDTTPVLGACAEGDVILMTQWCPHHSTSNFSKKCRWSMDTRYHVSGTPSGRDWYPATPVRSAIGSPIVTDPAEWRASWSAAHATDNPGIQHRVVEAASVSK